MTITIISVVVLMKRFISSGRKGCPCVSTHNAIERLRDKARAIDHAERFQIRTLPKRNQGDKPELVSLRFVILVG